MTSQNKKPRRQSTFRAHGERGYTKLRNDFLQSPTLSHETMGLVAQMLSRSPEWQHTAAGIAATSASGIKKVWRMLAEAEEHGFIRRAQPRDFDGKFAVFDYLVSDEPAVLIRAVVEEIEEIQRSSPHTQNGSAAPHTLLRCAAKRCTADGMQEKKESKKEIYEEKKISLSHAAQPTAAADERDAALARFEKVWSEGRWHPNTSRSAAQAEFVKLPTEDQERAVVEAPRYKHAMRNNDFPVTLNKWLRESMFDRPKPVELGTEGYPQIVLDKMQAAKAEAAGPPPDPAIQWRANIEKRCVTAVSRQIFKTQILRYESGVGRYSRETYGPFIGESGCILVEYFPDLAEEDAA